MAYSFTRTDINLYLKEITKFIDSINKPVKVSFKHPGNIEDCNGILDFRNNEAVIQLEADPFVSHIWSVGKVLKRSYVSWGGYSAQIKNLFVDKLSTDTGITASSQQLSSSGFVTKKRYYRLIIPVEKSINFHHYINHSAYESDFGIISSTCVKAVIEEVTVIAYYFNDREGNCFLGLEIKRILDFDDFCDKTFALKNALGYLLGKMEGNVGYFFTYTNRRMEHFTAFRFQSFRATISTIYTPINSNPFAYIRHRRIIAEKLYKAKTLCPLSEQQLSLLTSKLYSSGEFTSVVMLIMECGEASLLFRPGGYAIALEAISDIITDDLKSNLKPIPDKALARKLIKDLKGKLKEYEPIVSIDGYKTVEGRIEYINQPTNKARLLAPFTALGIKLLEEDMKILNTRNDFLHGRIPDLSNLGNDRPDSIKNNEMYYASIRLYTLLNMLIMKWIGFDNYVINYPKIHEKFCKIKLKEPYYRKV